MLKGGEMRAAKIVAIVIGALLIIIGLALLVPGVVVLGITGAQTDGFFTTSDQVLTSTGHALATGDVDMDIGRADWITSGGIGVVRIRASSTGSAPVFVGIGPTDQVNAYLDGVAYDEVTDPGFFSSPVEYLHHDGGAPSAPPGQQIFWTARQEGTGTQTLEWTVIGGNWTAVLMNADASAPVEASVSLGVHLGFLRPLGIGLTVAGVVLLAVGIILVVLGVRRRREPIQPAYAGGPEYPPGQQPTYQQPPYGAPPYQQPPPGTSPYQQAPYGQPPHGQPPYPQPGSDNVPPAYQQPQGAPPPTPSAAPPPPPADSVVAPPSPAESPAPPTTSSTPGPPPGGPEVPPAQAPSEPPAGSS